MFSPLSPPPSVASSPASSYYSGSMREKSDEKVLFLGMMEAGNKGEPVRLRKTAIEIIPQMSITGEWQELVFLILRYEAS